MLNLYRACMNLLSCSGNKHSAFCIAEATTLAVQPSSTVDVSLRFFNLCSLEKLRIIDCGFACGVGEEEGQMERVIEYATVF